MPNKDNETEFIIDGIISEKEWKNAIQVDLDYEVNPGNNIIPKEKTKVYIVYSDTHLYVGFYAIANPKEIRASIRSRDDLGMISDDFVIIAFDTYGDSRNNYLLLSNAFGSQLDARAVNALTDEDRYDINFNVDHETSGSIVSNGYQVEFKIPFSSISFPNSKNQKWKIRLTTRYIEKNRQGVFVESNTSRLDRDNACKLCQLDDEIIMSDIEIE